MSFYATLAGEIKYPDQESFDAVLTRLEAGGWVEDGYFMDETGDKITNEKGIDKESLVITIPRFCHRNLSRVDFFLGGAEGWLVGTSTDGCFQGWVISDGNEDTYELEEWARENLEEGNKEAPDQDVDFDKYADWTSMVENEFHSDYAG